MTTSKSVMLNAKVSPELLAEIDAAVELDNRSGQLAETDKLRTRSDFVRDALARQLKHEKRYPSS